MSEFAHLWLFFLMVLGIIVLPGMDMAFVMVSALAGGRKAGVFVVAGVVAGAVCHVVAGALGVDLLFKLVPGLIDMMLIVGALYVGWIGVSPLRSRASTDDGGDSPITAKRSAWATFRQALMTCLLNPKAYLFMLEVFPQFLRATYGPVWIQAMALGAIIAVTQIAVYGGQLTELVGRTTDVGRVDCAAGGRGAGTWRGGSVVRRAARPLTGSQPRKISISFMR